MIAYSYTVLSVDSARKTMIVRYEASGYPTLEVPVLMPGAGETLDAAAAAGLPTYSWMQSARPVETVTPGAFGVGATAPMPLIAPGMPFKQFYGLFTDSERTAVIAATQTDVQAKRRYDELLMTGLVSTALPEVDMFLSRLVTLGTITGERKSAIIAAMG